MLEAALEGIFQEVVAGVFFGARECAATTQIGGEQEASRRLLRRESTVLLNATVTADALFGNPENVHLIGSEKGGDYLISLKDNQPKLATAAAETFETAPFLI